MNKLLIPLLLSCAICPAQQSGLLPQMDILNPLRPTGTLAYSKVESQSVINAATQTILNYSSGDGYVDNLFIAILGGGAGTLADTVNVYYNGSGSATISLPLSNLCMSVYQDSTITNTSSFFGNAAVQWNVNHAAGGVSCDFKLPIPFTGGIKIDLINNSGSTVTMWATAEYQTGVPNTWAKTRVLHIDANNITGVAANTATTLVNYSGSPGRFVGLYMMNDDVPGSVTPKGAELEGNINLFLDGSGTASVQSGGTEDWFGSGFYFGATSAAQWTGTSNAGNAGQISSGWSTGGGDRGTTFMGNTAYFTEGVYRLHLQDKRYFNSGLKITVACGDTSQIAFTGTCTQYWTIYYYTQN